MHMILKIDFLHNDLQLFRENLTFFVSIIDVDGHHEHTLIANEVIELNVVCILIL